MRLVTVALAALLAVVQAELWFGKNGIGRVMGLEQRVAEQQAKNKAASERNDRLAAEVRDLREGLEMVEEKARFELGMVKPDEIYVHVTPRR